MDITYTVGPRYINGVNIDIDASAALSKVVADQEISDPVTGIAGTGYEPGQKNKDGGDL